jgi:hypothetical protein
MKGSGCAKRSAAKRLEDSAVQIFSYRLCGQPGFALRIERATLRAMRLYEALSSCAGEQLDLDALLEDRINHVSRRASGLRCDAALRGQLKRRRPELESTVLSSEDPLPAILDRLLLQIDSNGVITEHTAPQHPSNRAAPRAPGSSASLPGYFEVFDAICVGTRFSELGFSEASKAFDEVDKLDSATLAASGGGRVGYKFTHHGMVYVAKYAEMMDGTFLSRSCSITFRAEDPRSVAKSLRANYKVQSLGSERQGGSSMSYFQASLVGYAGPTGISLQSGSGLVSLSLIQMP